MDKASKQLNEKLRESNGRNQPGNSKNLEQHRAAFRQQEAAREYSHSITIRNLPEGPSSSGMHDITSGIHKKDLHVALKYIINNEHYLQTGYESLLLHKLITDKKNGEVIKILNEWKDGEDEIKKAFAEQALQHAEKRREKYWHSDD